MAVLATKEKAILKDVETTLSDLDYFAYVDLGFISPFKGGNRFPMALVLGRDTDFPERRQRRRVLAVHVIYYVRHDPENSLPVYKGLNQARDRILGSADSDSAHYGGLKKDPKRCGNADWTEYIRDARNAEVFAPFGLQVALFPPYGVGRVEVRCPYCP